MPEPTRADGTRTLFEIDHNSSNNRIFPIPILKIIIIINE
jgi:hypothetical protein